MDLRDGGFLDAERRLRLRLEGRRRREQNESEDESGHGGIMTLKAPASGRRPSRSLRSLLGLALRARGAAAVRPPLFACVGKLARQTCRALTSGAAASLTSERERVPGGRVSG